MASEVEAIVIDCRPTVRTAGMPAQFGEVSVWIECEWERLSPLKSWRDMASITGVLVWAVDKPPKPLTTRGNFFIYLAAFICFVLAALGEGWRFGARTRAGLAPRIVLVPLGLALFVLPQVIAYGRGF